MKGIDNKEGNDMIEFLIPMGMILLGLIGLTIYILGIALRDATRQIISMNERLMVLFGTRDGGEAVGRALVASAKHPKKVIPGVSGKEEKPKKPTGYFVTVGGN